MKKRITCLVVALCLLTGLLSACGGKTEAKPLYAQRGRVERETLGDLVPAADAAAILANLAEAGKAGVEGWTGTEEDENGSGADLGVPLEASQDGGTVATDGAYIYMLDSYGLTVCSAAGAQSEILSYTRVTREGEAWDQRLYLAPNRTAVLYTISGSDSEEWNDAAQVRLTVLDTSDKRAPKELAKVSVDGKLVEAYLLEGTLYLVTQRTLWNLPAEAEAETLLPRLSENGRELRLEPGDVYLSPDPARTALTVTAAVRLEDGRIADALAFTDGVEAVCPEGERLYLSRTLWPETRSEPYREDVYTVLDCTASAKTEIKRLALDGTLRLENGCVLEGALPEPSALDVEEGAIRAAAETDSRSYASYTDEKHGWTNYEQRSRSRGDQLVLLDENLEITGALTSLGGDEGVRAVRFLGRTALLYGAGEADPVFTVDLSDPAAPAAAGSLGPEERAAYLVSWGKDLVLSLGEPGAEGGWRIAMLDLSDPAKPVTADSLKLKGYAPAGDLADRGLLFADPETGLIGFPAAGKNGNEYLLLRWTGAELNKKGTFELEYVSDNARGLLVDGLLYICSPGEICVTDPDTMKVVADVSNAVG